MSGTAISGTELQRALREAERLLRAGNLPAAMRLADEAVGNGAVHPNLLVLAAYHQRDTGNGQRALALAEQARQISPRDVDVLNALGNCLVHLGRCREALKPFDAALRQAPHAYLVRYNKAAALEELQELERARVEFERVVESRPDHVESLSRLATLAMQRGDPAAARDYAIRALKHDPQHAASHLSLASAELGLGQPEAALARLQSLLRAADLTPRNRSIAYGLKGDALDRLDRVAEAFDAYRESQSIQRAAHMAEFARPDQESSAALADRFIAFFAAADRDIWRAHGRHVEAEGAATHAFLVGFPRSGTTMLEQILASHPDIEAMSERSCLIEAQQSFAAAPDGLKQLGAMSSDALAPWRDAYWKRVGEEGLARRSAVFVDKMPLYSVFLGLIARLFPRARIIFALRDPRDVVLSCFRRRFVMTQQMFELTSLESAAAYYDRVMRLCEIYRDRLGLSFCDMRHEDMVADIEGQSRRVCDFLGVPWSAEMINFSRTVGSRSINTPSGPQLARGLSREGIGQWRRYREQLSPVLPQLAPWAARFGYSAD